MLPRLRVHRASKSGAQRRRSECLVPGVWGVDVTKGSNPTESDRSKKVVHMDHNPTRGGTYGDAVQSMNGDFPALTTNCEKPVVW